MTIGVVLYQPEIPQNTGNIARTCAATNTPLHLIRPLGFSLANKHLKRAGLDYWEQVTLSVHDSFERFLKDVRPKRCVLFSKRGLLRHHTFEFREGDFLVFGSETRGLPQDLLDSGTFPTLFIPIIKQKVRSLNLSSSVSIALYEALRQTGLLDQMD